MQRFICYGMAATLSVALPAVARAQTSTAAVDARWLPWIGCWRPADLRSPEEGVLICVVPAAETGARIMTIAGERVVLEETIVPDGLNRAVDEAACRGSRRSEWSRDGQRVYSSAELTCEKEAPRTVSALALMTADAEWIDVQVVSSGSQENVRVRRYQRTAEPPPDPSLISPELAARAARAALGSRLTVDHIVDASRKVTPRVIEALLFETKANFPLNSRQLIALDDAGVADTIIDLMVAFSFPQKFEVRRSAGGSSAAFPGFGLGGFGWNGFADSAFPWYFDPYYSFYSPFAYSRGGFWDGYYYGLSNGISAGSNEGGSQPERHGRVINGSGYTQVVSRPPENATASERGRAGDAGGSTSAASSGSSGGGSSAVSSGGYSSGGGGGGGGDSGRTAIPR